MVVCLITAMIDVQERIQVVKWNKYYSRINLFIYFIISKPYYSKLDVAHRIHMIYSVVYIMCMQLI